MIALFRRYGARRQSNDPCRPAIKFGTI